jgi:hypothetical protein
MLVVMPRSGGHSASTSSTKIVLQKHIKPGDGQCSHLLGHIRDICPGGVNHVLPGGQRSRTVYVLQSIETYVT